MPKSDSAQSRADQLIIVWKTDNQLPRPCQRCLDLPATSPRPWRRPFISDETTDHGRQTS